MLIEASSLRMDARDVGRAIYAIAGGSECILEFGRGGCRTDGLRQSFGRRTSVPLLAERQTPTVRPPPAPRVTAKRKVICLDRV
jgi:hypothetical protein